MCPMQCIAAHSRRTVLVLANFSTHQREFGLSAARIAITLNRSVARIHALAHRTKEFPEHTSSVQAPDDSNPPKQQEPIP